jgi:hypothetical protein
LGMQDALNVRYNAARTAYGYETQSQSQSQQAQLDSMAASNASTAGMIGGAGTMLTGVGSAGAKWAGYNTGIGNAPST